MHLCVFVHTLHRGVGQARGRDDVSSGCCCVGWGPEKLCHLVRVPCAVEQGC